MIDFGNPFDKKKKKNANKDFFSYIANPLEKKISYRPWWDCLPTSRKSLSYAVVDANRYSRRLHKNGVSEMGLLIYMCRNAVPDLQVQGCVPWSAHSGRQSLVYMCRKAVPGLHMQEGVLWYWLGFREENKNFGHGETFSSNHRIRKFTLRWNDHGDAEGWLIMKSSGLGLILGWWMSTWISDSQTGSHTQCLQRPGWQNKLRSWPGE